MAGDRGGRAARHERRVGQQRAAAGASHAREPDPTTPIRRSSTPSSRSCSPATSTRSSVTTSRRSSRCSATTPCMSMPPYDFWLQGPEEIGRWFLGEGSGCRGSRLLATQRTAALLSARTAPTDQGGHFAMGDPGDRDRQAAGSSGITTSSTPGCSQRSVFRPASIRRTCRKPNSSVIPTRSSNPASSEQGSRTSMLHPMRRAPRAATGRGSGRCRGPRGPSR